MSFWVFKLSWRLCVWYSRGLCVFPVFASSVCLETHCVCRRFLQRICIQLRAQNRTALHIQKIPKKRVPTPPNPPVRNHHHTGIWLLSTLCGFYIHLVPKGGRFAKESKKKKLNTKMRVFFVFFGDGGQNVAAFRIRLSRFNVSTSLWWWKLGSITSWKLEGYKLVAKMVLQTHSKEYTIHTSKIVLQTRCIW